ncbi:transcriptional repressor LexA [bacterium]|nr:transcriptional repressor LexA [bacterium]
MQESIIPLTPKEKLILDYIEGFILEEGLSPTFTEIKDHFNFASYNSVQRYLKQLHKKKYLFIPGGNQKRAIQVLKPSNSLKKNLNNLTSTDEENRIPLLGKVAAGLPLESHKHDEYIEVPISLVKSKNQCYALEVSGDSMIEEGIFDGDTIIINAQNVAENGEIVVAEVDNETTLKRIYKKKDQIELRPANSTMESFFYPASQVSIKGKLISLVRSY